MINVFKDNKELNDLVNEIYINIKNVEEEYINDFFSNSSGVRQELEFLQDDISKIDRQKDGEILKLYIKNFMYSLPTLKVKKENERILIDLELETILEEKKDYTSRFQPRFYEIKEKICYIFDKYYEIFLTNGTRRDLKEMYAIYNAIIYYLILTLPETYKEEILKESELTNYTSSNLSDNNMRSAYLLQKFDIVLKEYIIKKYKLKDFLEKVEYKHKLAI